MITNAQFRGVLIPTAINKIGVPGVTLGHRIWGAAVDGYRDGQWRCVAAVGIHDAKGKNGVFIARRRRELYIAQLRPDRCRAVDRIGWKTR